MIINDRCSMPPDTYPVVGVSWEDNSDLVKLFLIGVFALLSLLVTIYAILDGGAVMQERYYLIPHLYILPIILVALWYPQRGTQVILLLIASIVALTGFFYFFRHTIDPVFSLLNAGIDLWIVLALAMKVRIRLPTAERKSTIAGKEDLGGYVEALKLNDEGVRIEAVRALGSSGDPAVLEPLVGMLQDESRAVREEVARSLGKIPIPGAVPPLIQLLKDDHRVIRETAVQALGTKGPDVVPELLERLNDPDWHVRMGVAIALRIIGDPRAIDPLILRFQDENRFVRREAVKSVGRLGDTRAQEALMYLLQDEDQTVRLRAEVALMKIHGRQFQDEDIDKLVDL
jgi:hypothetical protein